MAGSVKVEIAPEEIVKAVKAMQKKERDALLEDILASTAPEYLDSIREARADFRAGKVKSHKEVFGK
jgi:DNA-binding TFAR19-related protein (PDSD5 family)